MNTATALDTSSAPGPDDFPVHLPKLKNRRVPINLRQSGNSDAKMLISTRVRKSPYWHLSHAEGCWCYTVYNRIYHPRAYVPLEEGGLLKEYEYITQHVTMWNVAVERQIQVKGPDAADFVNLVITRDVHTKLKTGQGRYVVLCNQYGGIINDPVLLRVADDEFWFSISDSDVWAWLQGLNAAGKFDVTIHEIDVCPVQIQGPKAKGLMTKLFGSAIEDVPYYGVMAATLNGMDVEISRTGFSAEVGYEIYLREATKNADRLWHAVKEAGAEFNLHVIAPSHIRRLEAGILSWGQDMDVETNPFEVGLDWQIDFEKDDFIGKEALKRIHDEGVTEKLVGLRMGGKPLTWYNEDFYLVHADGGPQGYVSSAFWSPSLDTNIALAMMPVEYAEIGHNLQVALPGDGLVDAEVVPVPFKDPKKQIPLGKQAS
ncbi:MAG: glycine cleavage T C-terminal barrel domain-containing protein [Pseudomonadota bacterium]